MHQNSIKFEISWISCNNNAAADTIFKLIDYDEQQTTIEFFQKYLKYGENLQFTDLQTMNTQKQKNSVLRTGTSDVWCPGTSDVNAFTFIVSWSPEINYLSHRYT